MPTTPSANRLLGFQRRLELLRGRLEAKDNVAVTLHDSLLVKADQFIDAPPAVRKMEGIRLLNVSRQALERLITLGLVAKLTGEARFVARVDTDLRAICAFVDWNPAHFLDTAEMALAVALACDWLQDDLPAETVALARRALIDKALRPSFEGDPRWLFWIKHTNNWNSVCHAGLIAAALAVRDSEAELANRTIERAVACLPLALSAFAPDGAYVEGPTYWAYGTTFHVLAADLLTQAFGDDRGVASGQGFLESARYIAQATLPDGGFYNYGDARTDRHFLPALVWLAARHPEGPAFLAAELRHLDASMRDYVHTLYNPEHFRLLGCAALWWAEAPAPAPAPTVGSWSGRGPNPAAILRVRTPADQADAVLALKGGSPSGPHAHMDAGSFVYCARGVRWAVDLGLQDYHSLESAGIALWNFEQESPRWRVFRLGSEGHNILRFDQRAQAVAGRAELVGTTAQPAAARLDLGSLYPGLVTEARREFHLRDDGGAEIADTWRAGRAPLTASAQWLTFATARPEGADGVLLEQDGRRLRLRAGGSNTPRIMIEDAAALLAPHDAPNPGLTRIRVEVACAAGEAGWLRIEARPAA